MHAMSPRLKRLGVGGGGGGGESLSSGVVFGARDTVFEDGDGRR